MFYFYRDFYRDSSSSFSPDSVAELIMWLDANDTSTITETSGSVSQWDDKSGNENHVTQSSGIRQPLTNFRQLNNRNVITFGESGISELEANGFESNLQIANDFSIFIVFQSDRNDSFMALLSCATNTNDRFTIGTNDSGDVAFASYDGAFTSKATAVDQDSPYVIEGHHSSSNIITSYLNGAEMYQTTTPGTAPNQGFSIGLRPDGNNGLEGVIGEVLVYSRLLNEAERNNIENYLLQKWGISKDNEVDIPATISGLTAWFDPSDESTITDVAGDVSQWDNKRNNNNNATQSVSADQMSTGAATINGLNVLTGDGTDFFDIDVSVKTVFFVWGNIADNFNVIIGGVVGGSVADILINPVSNLASFDGFGNEEGRWANGAGTLSVFGQDISTKTISNTGGIGLFEYQNGPFDFNSLASRSGSTSFRFDGEFGEIIVYDRNLTTEEQNKVGNYLANKWGRTWNNLA
jgi:hypothetical protein